MQAPEIVRPKGAPAADSLSSLSASREALLAVCRDADGLAVQAVKAPHALLGKLDLYQWVLMVGQHERRHAAQLRSIAARLRQEGATP